MAVPVFLRPPPRRVPVVTRLLAWLARVRQRRQESAQLLSMTDRDLRDIGLTRYEALIEARKSIWR